MAFASLRGAEEGPMLYAFEGGLLSVIFRAAPEHRLMIHGQVLLSDSTMQLESYKLVARAAPAATTGGNLADAGTFVAGPLPPGDYQLLLRGLHHRVVIPHLALTE
jgi:hypothetical protein